MSLTRESILSFLKAEGGKAPKSDLVSKFKVSVESADPAERARNRELFKTHVNSLAVVREIEGVRYVVLKKPYQHQLGGCETAESHAERREHEEIPLTGGQQHQTESCIDTGRTEARGPAVPEDDQEEESQTNENPAEFISPIQEALRRSRYANVPVKRMINFDINKEDPDTEKGPVREGGVLPHESKPYGLPLRMPPSSTRIEIRKLKEDPDHPPKSPKLDALRNKRRLPSVEAAASGGSPQLRRAARSTKAPEEPAEARIPSLFPLEQPEHDWLVCPGSPLCTGPPSVETRTCW